MMQKEYNLMDLLRKQAIWTNTLNILDSWNTYDSIAMFSINGSFITCIKNSLTTVQLYGEFQIVAWHMHPSI